MVIKNPNPKKTIIENFKNLKTIEKVGIGIGGLLIFKLIPLWMLVTGGIGGFAFFKSDTGKKFLNDIGGKINQNNKTLK